MSAINIGEVYYFLRKHHSEALAESWRELSKTLPVTIEVPTIDEIWNAAHLKGLYTIACADAFAVALAQKHRCSSLRDCRTLRCQEPPMQDCRRGVCGCIAPRQPYVPALQAIAQSISVGRMGNDLPASARVT